MYGQVGLLKCEANLLRHCRMGTVTIALSLIDHVDSHTEQGSQVSSLPYLLAITQRTFQAAPF